METVCRVMGRRAAQECRLAAAIWWGVRANDSSFTSHVAHKVFQICSCLCQHMNSSGTGTAKIMKMIERTMMPQCQRFLFRKAFHGEFRNSIKNYFKNSKISHKFIFPAII